ncbi:DUF6958 family protein [Nitrincola sp. MINF-07-Sa-05]|uniref:DUF6958 family protein n=1 Tax=Nitrincola salilacus TaxID=3400273 RepID=UPI003917F7CF
MRSDTVLCETPTLGKQPVRIPAWKYHLVKGGIITALYRQPGLPFKLLADAVREVLTDALPEELGSLSWPPT